MGARVCACVYVCVRVHACVCTCACVCVLYGCLLEGAGIFFGIEIKPSEGKMQVLR